MKITYFGHAALGIEVGGKHIIVDPFITGNPLASAIDINTLKADLAVLQAQLDKTVIKAPFAGTLGLRMISMGAYLTPATVITTIQQVNQLKIDFSVPEFYAQKIKKGAVVYVQSADNKTTADAVVTATEPLINATTRNLKVRAVLKGQAFNLGAFVPSFKFISPINTLASSQRLASIKD